MQEKVYVTEDNRRKQLQFYGPSICAVLNFTSGHPGSFWVPSLTFPNKFTSYFVQKSVEKDMTRLKSARSSLK